MLDTKCLYQFTDILQQPSMNKVFRYMENHEYFKDNRKLHQLFVLLYYEEPYSPERIRAFEVVLTRDEE